MSTTTTTATAKPEWLSRRERSNPIMMKFIVWVALRLGRKTARALLYPICLYFVLVSPLPRATSKRFLCRVLGRKPRLTELYRHHFFFAACLLDRIFLLDGQLDLFDVHVHGEDVVSQILAQGKGCILVGAHVGSFEIVRAVGRNQSGLRVALLMYEENARKLAGEINAINPRLAMEIIGLGRKDSMLKVLDQLEAGAFIGILADRTIEAEEQASCCFLGQTAPFPSGPFRLARILRRPVVMMLGLYGGGCRYDVHFEMLADWSDVSGSETLMTIEQVLHRYVERLEHHVRLAPYNWFNFYDIWK